MSTIDDNSTPKNSHSFLFRYALSCAAATVAETATYPLDMVKTRLQIQGETNLLPFSSSSEIPNSNSQNFGQNRAGSSSKRGMISTATKIAKEEGMLKLWQGCVPAVIRHYVYTGVRVLTYETLRDKVFRHRSDSVFPFWAALCSGVFSGGFAQFLASPTDLVKVQMQMEGRRRVEGHPPRVNNMLQAFKLLWSEGGVPRLWRGWMPNCARAALVNMADLVTYDKVKHTILRRSNLQDNYVTHGLSSLCSGLTAAIVSTPVDVLKTRIMNQPTDQSGRNLLYKSSLDCLIKTKKNEGLRALYKGFIPTWMRMAPWSLTFWISYERIRRWTGVESF